jgi:biotin synthase
MAGSNLAKVLEEEPQLDRAEMLRILSGPDDDLADLLAEAYVWRKKHKGDLVSIQLLTNARSGNCTQNCAYCAQSRDSGAEIDKYRMVSYEKLLEDGRAVRDKHLARHCIGLSGIRFRDDEIEEFAERVRRIKQESAAQICCSIGILTREQAEKLKAAGVDRINHNLNSSRNYYPSICTTHTYEERIANIHMLQNMGFEICSGGIVGLGEGPEDVVDMLLEIQAIAPQAVPINFLIPITGTRLESANTSHLRPEYCLKVLALTRLLNPEADIRCAGGREVYLKGREKEMFYAVDSIFASGYLTTGGDGIEETIRTITEAGFRYQIEVE